MNATGLGSHLGRGWLEVEPLVIGPWGELLEWPGVTGSWIVVQEPVLLLGGKLQIEPRCREPGWVGRKVERKVLPIVPRTKFRLILVFGVKRCKSFPITHVIGHTHRH